MFEFTGSSASLPQLPILQGHKAFDYKSKILIGLGPLKSNILNQHSYVLKSTKLEEILIFQFTLQHSQTLKMSLHRQFYQRKHLSDKYTLGLLLQKITDSVAVFDHASESERDNISSYTQAL